MCDKVCEITELPRSSTIWRRVWLVEYSSANAALAQSVEGKIAGLRILDGPSAQRPPHATRNQNIALTFVKIPVYSNQFPQPRAVVF